MTTRTPPGPLPEGIIPWTAKFSGRCMCGKTIKQGQTCLYDRERRKLICKSCKKVVLAGSDVQTPVTAAQQTMDRVKQIHVMPRPLTPEVEAELDQLVERLRNEFAREYSARRLVCEVLRIPLDEDIVCIAMRYPEPCHRCGAEQRAGTAAMWRKSSHRIWCLECRAFAK